MKKKLHPVLTLKLWKALFAFSLCWFGFNVSYALAPVANFTANKTIVFEGRQVTFTDASTGTPAPASWTYNFPGGTPGTAATLGATVTYNTAGIYDVTHTATNTVGTGTLVKTNYITVYPAVNDNAGAFALSAPKFFCAGMQDVKVRIKNYGLNQITTGVTVNWSVDGVLQVPVTWSPVIDTLGSTSGNDTTVTLGTINFPAGITKTILAWTSDPNGVPDTYPINDTFTTFIKPSLSGTYTVGGVSPDFPDLLAAANEINTYGLCGPVVLNVNPGTYTGKFALTNVGGSSSVNTIQIIGTNKTTCIITDSIADAVVSFTNTGYITLQNMTVTNRWVTTCSGINIVNSSGTSGSGTTINNCIVNLPNVGSNTSYGIAATGTANALANNALDSITIDSNTINGGYYGIVLYGNSTGSPTYNRGYLIRNNTLNNIMTYGIYTYYIYNPLMVINNSVNLNPSNYGNSIGFYSYYNQNSSASVSSMFTGNRIKDASNYGMYIYYAAGTATAPHKIYNNLIYGEMRSTANYGININIATNAGNYEVYHNTVQLNGYGTTQEAFYYSNTANVSGLLAKNNIFVVNPKAGTPGTATVYPAYFASSPAGNQINYNTYYNSFNTNMVYRTSAYTTATYKTATAGGDSSFNMNPFFAGTVSLTNGCSAGLDLTASVPADINGLTRSSTPTGGAVEFVPVANDMLNEIVLAPLSASVLGPQDLSVRVRNAGTAIVSGFDISYTLNGGTPVTLPWAGSSLNPCDTASFTFTGANQITLVSGQNDISVYTSAPNATIDGNRNNDTLKVTYYNLNPLNGNYTIGGAGANFPTFADATNALQVAGISGPVNFTVNAGTYTGQVVINGPITGSSPANTITFDGVDATTRIITSNASATFLVKQVNYLTLRNLTVINTAYAYVSAIASVGNSTNNAGTGFTVKKCIINIPNTNISASYGIMVTNVLMGNADGNQWADSITIDSNTINGAYYGISISTNGNGNAAHNRGHKMRWNTVNAYYYGVRAYYIYNAVDISHNTIMMNPANPNSYGIYCYYNQNSLAGTNTTITGNNIVSSGYGLYFYYFTSPAGDKLKVYNNMSRTSGTYAAYVYSGAAGANEVEFYHNTLSTTSNQAYTFYYYNSLATGQSYFKNNIFSASNAATTPAYFGTNPAGNSVNYNNYFNVNGGPLVYRGISMGSSTYRTATGGGDSSFNVKPGFVSSTNMQLTSGCIKGVNLTASVATDINDSTRINPPVIGAHEASGFANDASVELVSVPTPFTTAARDVAVRIHNYSAGTLTSVTVNYKLNSGVVKSTTWTGTLAGCDTATVLFTGANQITLTPGVNNLLVYTTAPNGVTDQYTGNDTLSMILSTISKNAGTAFTGAATTGQNIRMLNTPTMDSTSNFSAEAWVKLTNLTVNQKIVARTNNLTTPLGGGFTLGVQTGGIYPQVWNSAGTAYSVTAGTIPLNTWTHLAMTWASGDSLKCYINGSQVASIPNGTLKVGATSQNMTIGSNSWDFVNLVTGSIDEVRVWNITLDSTMIRRNMHHMLTGSEPGLISYIQMNEGVGATGVSDPVSGATGIAGNGVLTTSTLPAGNDSSLTLSGVLGGSYTNGALTLNFSDLFDNPCDLTMTEISGAPNALPSATYKYFDRYWVVRTFGDAGAYATDMTFTMPSGYLNTSDPDLGLYRRGYGVDSLTWYLARLSSGITATSVTFSLVDTFGQFTIASNGTSVLPVSLLSFGATRSGENVSLKWQTANEINSSHFEIERAYGNTDKFIQSGVVKASGSSSSVRAYTFTDKEVKFSRGTIYYRLRQVDNDGKYSYSPIVSISPDKVTSEISVSPNPFSTSFNVDFTATIPGDALMTIADIQGKVLFVKKVSVTTGSTKLSFDELSNVESGVYFVKVEINGVSKTYKLLKQ
jgi:hypothetical protein